ncbi:MAG: DUF1538 domain-containing protein [Clostridia bacterium]|nr:DUF1538 domain-containing protein [Clostridia bacterium]
MANFKEAIKEVIYSVFPVTFVIFILQFTLIRLPLDDFINFIAGVLLVSIGLVLFFVGVNIGLLPVGEMIGASLPKTGKPALVIFFGFLLGFVVTVAEPDVRVLATQVEIVSGSAIGKNLLIYSVALGVAIFVALAMVKIILDISINKILVVSYSLVLMLALVTPPDFLPVALDSGGVTTGPMTVPFILALGIGVSSVMRGRNASDDGFGLIALASVGPILAVMLLGVFFS